MAEFVIILTIELIIAFLCYFILKWRTKTMSLPIIAITACLIGFGAGWYASHRIVGNKMMSHIYSTANEKHKIATGKNLSLTQWESIRVSVLKDIYFIKMARIEATNISIMPFIFVLIIIMPFAYRHKR